MYDFLFKNKRASEYGVYAVRRPDIPIPERNIEYTELKSRNGALTKDYKTYKDISFQMELNFMAERPSDFGWKSRIIKSWLSGGGELILSDDSMFFKKVRNVSARDIARVSKRIGRFTAEFRCDPFEYVRENNVIANQEEIRNIYDFYSEPNYVITGNGLCTLTVNGNTFRVQVGTSATIDVSRMIAFNTSTGIVNNAMASGKYEDLRLHPGENTISITSGFDLSVVPNWRTL